MKRNWRSCCKASAVVLLALGTLEVLTAQSLLKQGGVLEPPLSQEVRCVLRVDSTPWKQMGPAPIEVRVENLADRDLDLRTVPRFYLTSPMATYSSPTDIVRNRSLVTPHQSKPGDEMVGSKPMPLKLHLNKRSSPVFQVDAAKTTWARSPLRWPGPLRYVAPGPYSLRLEFSAGGELVRSNEVKVSVENFAEPFLKEMFPDAPAKTQSSECFRFVTHKTPVHSVIQKCGRPEDDIGSGVHIFVWYLADGTVVYIDTPYLERIYSAGYTDRSGKTTVLVQAK